jgi:bifunctional UDP-N-acetylglucosamine pyrophosphorylase/glucosamine-1-phosphate N-acetyltransferase
MSDDTLQTIILAAGKGQRMKSSTPKVLHRVAGLSLLGHVLKLSTAAGCERVSVVIGPDMESVRAEALRWSPAAEVFVQSSQRGTGDAVLAARPALRRQRGDVLVLYADTPLIEAKTIARMRAQLDAGANVVVLGFEASDPTGYGRLVTASDGTLAAIREDGELGAGERGIGLCNSGVMAFRCPDLLSILDRIGNSNSKGEFYLTDAIEIARADGLKVAAITCPEEEVLGVNSREQLAAAEAVYQHRARRRCMADGVTMIDPDTVWFSHDTVVGQDVMIEPNVFFGPGVTLEDNVTIHANCHFVQAVVRSGAMVGPFARLRPGADIGPNVHIGNFVEVKNASLATGAKANHLSYIGDGSVGAGANIGAGTIFCNYDGFNKRRTEVGAGAFIGSNAALVAPVAIGDGAYVGAGSVITRDVPADALAIERSEMHVKHGWAAKFRALLSRQKAKAASDRTMPTRTGG